MTTLSWQPARHSWGPLKPWVDGQPSFSKCLICGAIKRMIQVKTERLLFDGSHYYKTSTRLATAEEPDVWLPPAKVRCIHRGLQVRP